MPVGFGAMYAVILAGGGGTRLWPLSRPETPKPFLPLLGEQSLLKLTVERVAGHADLPLAEADITIVTDRRYLRLVREQVPGCRVLAEPAGRNTAAAVARATAAIERPDEEVMLVLPADHRIRDDGVYRSVLAAAAEHLARGAFEVEAPLVTLGIEVSRPATEYGYLIPRAERGEDRGGVRAYPLRGFVEKPSAERAAELALEPGVAWNAGIFAWQRLAIRGAIDRYTGLMTLIGAVHASEAGLAAAYDQLKPVSIDYAVMEQAARDGRVVMAAMNVGWDDLGGWTALLAAIGGPGTGRVVQPGEAAEAGPDDLIVERIDGRLILAAGPRAILGTSPSALLARARAGRSAVEALLDRVSRWEARP
jgi:mannose-1-phosphate guanylyltransferase